MINVIDQDKCIGCGTCFKSCSLDVFRLDTDQSKVSPCMAACPAGTDIRGYNALVQQGKLEEAAQKLRQANPFPGITGRICFHPCEKECARNAVDGAVNINAVEQFLGDLDLPEEQPAVRHTAKVAVVGSGPAGLSCACFMARMATPSPFSRPRRAPAVCSVTASRLTACPTPWSRRMWPGLKPSASASAATPASARAAT